MVGSKRNDSELVRFCSGIIADYPHSGHYSITLTSIPSVGNGINCCARATKMFYEISLVLQSLKCLRKMYMVYIMPSDKMQ